MTTTGGAQKAIGGALVTLVSTLLLQILNNQPIDIETQTVEVSTLIGQLAASMVASGIAYGVVWFKENVLKLSDGSKAVQQFVKTTPSGTATVVDQTTGTPTAPVVRSSYWIGALVLLSAVALSACGPETMAKIETASGGVLTIQVQQCLVDKSIMAFTVPEIAEMDFVGKRNFVLQECSLLLDPATNIAVQTALNAAEGGLSE